MTTTEKNNALYEFRKFQQRHELLNAVKFNKALQIQAKQAAEYVKQGLFPVISATPIYEVLRPMYIEVATINGARILAGIKRDQKARMPMGFSDRMLQLIIQYYGIDFLNMSEDITQTTRDFIQRILIQAYPSGRGIDDIVKQITSTTITRQRARVIARTETVAAANFGGLATAKDTGLDLNKIWLSAKDERTRTAHRIADEQKKPVDGFFTIGGYEMKVPGDKGGKDGKPQVPGKLIINCRCSAVYEKVGR